jgi:diguanylate cyclase (GGDEF)-like protein
MDKRKSTRTAQDRACIQSVDAAWTALRASVASGQSGLALNPASDALMQNVLELQSAGKPASSRESSSEVFSESWVLRELACAREFNFDLPADLSAGVWRMEQAICTLLGVDRCAMLYFDEETGLYTSLAQMAEPQGQPLSFANIEDGFLETMLGTEYPAMQSHLILENGDFIGLVAVAEKADGQALEAEDQRMLDLLAPYLASKMSSFIHMKGAQTTPYIQGMVLELAEQLITAVDQDAIITTLLEAFARKLGFDACQYVGFNPENGMGEVLYEIKRSAANPENFRMQSYSHAGLESKRRPIREFGNLVGLISSMARNRFYLHLNGKKLGNRSLGDIFGIRGLQSALLLPVVDSLTGEIRGTFNLFKSNEAFIADDSREIARETVLLASQALSRSMVLEKALAMASSDELTGLINRRGYYQRFEAELERARRHQTPLCVVLIDVDHFKQFNDNYGHLSGDLILKALAELCTQKTRKSDVVCRFGGEEFAILLPDTSLKSAVELMERVRQNVESLQVSGFHGENLKITISVGLAEVNTKPKAGPGRTEISDALALADEQLYAAKNKGRNQVSYLGDEQAQSISQAG